MPPTALANRALGVVWAGSISIPISSSLHLETMDAIKSSSERKLIVLDYLDHILTPEYSSLFKFMKALRDQFKYQLSYVFLTSKIVSHDMLPIMGDSMKLPPNMWNICPSCLELSTTSFWSGWLYSPRFQTSQMKKLSGGIPSLVKICMLALRDGTSLDPNENLKLKGQLKKCIATNPNHPAYAKASLLQNYKANDLTAAETRLFGIIVANKNNMFQNQICDSVYPDVKTKLEFQTILLTNCVSSLRGKTQNLGSSINSGWGFLGFSIIRRALIQLVNHYNISISRLK